MKLKWLCIVSTITSSTLSSPTHNRPHSLSGLTSGHPTRPVTDASCAAVNAKKVSYSQRRRAAARMAATSPQRTPVPYSCPCGSAPTAGARWRRRTDKPLWSNRLGWVVTAWYKVVEFLWSSLLFFILNVVWFRYGMLLCLKGSYV